MVRSYGDLGIGIQSGSRTYYKGFYYTCVFSQTTNYTFWEVFDKNGSSVARGSIQGKEIAAAKQSAKDWIDANQPVEPGNGDGDGNGSGVPGGDDSQDDSVPESEADFALIGIIALFFFGTFILG